MTSVQSSAWHTCQSTGRGARGSDEEGGGDTRHIGGADARYALAAGERVVLDAVQHSTHLQGFNTGTAFGLIQEQSLKKRGGYQVGVATIVE